MPVFVYGLNHITASIDIRDRVAFPAEVLPGALQAAQRDLNLEELVILSTCNRMEIYYKARDAIMTPLLNWIAGYHGLSKQMIAHAFYEYVDSDAVRHMIQVASGLDSMVLGESQVLGQFKAAYEVARRAGVSGPTLNRIGQRTFAAAKRVRSCTSIGHNSLSIASIAVKLAQQVFGGSLENARTLLVGAGESISLMGKHLKSCGIRDMVIANRSLGRAERLAQTLDARALPLERMNEALALADIVIASTGSSKLVLGMDAVKQAICNGKNRRVFMIDLAVPRNIDPEIGKLDQVSLYTIDHLDAVIAKNHRDRSHAAQVAQEIIAAETLECVNYLRSLGAVDVICELHAKTRRMLEQEQDKAMARLARGQSPEDVLRQFGKKLAGKWLHAPSVELRRAATEGRSELLDATVRIHDLSDRKDFARSSRE